MGRLWSLGFAVVMVAGSAGAQGFGPNMVTNGDFETGDLSGWGTTASCQPFAVTTSAAIAGSYGAAAGNNGTCFGLTQMVSTPALSSPDLSYWVSFDAIASSDEPVTFHFQFGSSGFTNTHYFFPSAAPVHLISYSQRPVTDETPLVFEVTGSTGTSVRFDNISVAATTPEPNSLFLLGSGLLGIVPVMARRRARL